MLSADTRQAFEPDNGGKPAGEQALSSGVRTPKPQDWLRILGDLDPAKMIAASRLLLAVAALIAIYIDPTQPSRSSDLAYGILVGYALASAAILGLAYFTQRERIPPLVIHSADLAIISALVYCTEGPTSPLFALFTFAIISGALRWGAMGAAATAVALLAVFVGVTTLSLGDAADFDANRVIVRTVYLVVVAALIGYFGWHRQRSAERLARLADWPEHAPATGDDPPLAPSLMHATLVLGGDRLLVLWEEQGQPGWRLAHWNGERCLFSDWDGVAPPFEDESPNPAPELCARFHITRYAASSFDEPPYRGYVLLIDPAALSTELDPLMAIVARRIGAEFAHHRLSQTLADAAVARERARLARDMHDGILQDLTAAGLHLKAMSRSAAGENAATFDDLIALLMEQQARIREFVTTMGPKPASLEPTPLARPLGETVNALRRQWKCEIVLDVMPSGGAVTTQRQLQLRLIVSEAVANAVKHGRATRMHVKVSIEGTVRLEVQDNGQVATDDPGAQTSVETPFSIVRRVQDAGGTCTFQRNDAGGLLTATIPER